MCLLIGTDTHSLFAFIMCSPVVHFASFQTSVSLDHMSTGAPLSLSFSLFYPFVCHSWSSWRKCEKVLQTESQSLALSFARCIFSLLVSCFCVARDTRLAMVAAAAVVVVVTAVVACSFFSFSSSSSFFLSFSSCSQEHFSLLFLTRSPPSLDTRSSLAAEPLCLQLWAGRKDLFLSLLLTTHCVLHIALLSSPLLLFLDQWTCCLYCLKREKEEQEESLTTNVPVNPQIRSVEQWKESELSGWEEKRRKRRERVRRMMRSTKVATRTWQPRPWSLLRGHS